MAKLTSDRLNMIRRRINGKIKKQFVVVMVMLVVMMLWCTHNYHHHYLDHHHNYTINSLHPQLEAPSGIEPAPSITPTNQSSLVFHAPKLSPFKTTPALKTSPIVKSTPIFKIPPIFKPNFPPILKALPILKANISPILKNPPTINQPPYLSRRCYTYAHLNAHNTCCPALQYRPDPARITQCFQRAAHARDRLEDQRTKLTVSPKQVRQETEPKANANGQMNNNGHMRRTDIDTNREFSSNNQKGTATDPKEDSNSLNGRMHINREAKAIILPEMESDAKGHLHINRQTGDIKRTTEEYSTNGLINDNTRTREITTLKNKSNTMRQVNNEKQLKSASAKTTNKRLNINNQTGTRTKTKEESHISKQMKSKNRQPETEKVNDTNERFNTNKQLRPPSVVSNISERLTTKRHTKIQTKPKYENDTSKQSDYNSQSGEITRTEIERNPDEQSINNKQSEETNEPKVDSYTNRQSINTKQPKEESNTGRQSINYKQSQEPNENTNTSRQSINTTQTEPNGDSNTSRPSNTTTPTGENSPPRPPPPPSDTNNLKETKPIHWVLVGDSHIRYIFHALLDRLRSEPLQYHLSSFPKGEWRDIQELFKTRTRTIHTDTQEVRHMEVPLRITYHWDPLLLRLPAIIYPWLQQHDHPPVLLLTGGALHWMRTTLKIYKANGVEAAVGVYRDQVEYVARYLAPLTTTTNVVFKLMDYIAGTLGTDLHLPKNVDMYNRAATDALRDSGVAVWDATVSISERYVAQCEVDPQDTGRHWWACSDRLHIGFIAIQEYLEMLLNHMCTSR